MKKFLLTLSIIGCYQFAMAQIYGLAVKNSPSSNFLGQINPASGVVTNISTISLGINYMTTLGVVDPKRNKYYYESGSNQFITVDLSTGNLNANPAITNPAATYFDLPAYNCKDSMVYGLAKATGPTALYLATINPATGVAVNISASSLGSGYILTPSTLDPITKRFYFEDGSFKFTSVDLTTGTVIAAPVITYQNTNANLFDSFVYNCSDSTIYGLARKNSTSVMFLSKINPMTGFVSFISASNINSNGQTSGGATIDQVNNVFYFQDGNQNLLGVSLVTGNIVSNAPVTNTNANSFTNFRSKSICNCSAFATGLEKQKLIAGIKVYPNPSSGSINVILHGLTDKVQTRLISIAGQILSEKEFTSVNSFQYELNGIAPGIYFLETDLDGYVSRTKVMVE
jgi:hypothetical protein